MTVIIAVIAISSSFGQFKVKQALPSGPPAELRYHFPVNPGQQGFLAGTMGELRSTHFHAGIDIRTNNLIGLPVLTAQQGYISRVWISTSGYGNALFVTHPNHQTTVYAHLDRFKGPLADIVRAEQYRTKSFDQDLFFQSTQFPVQDGDTIAYSGNTGGSQGPHLHFEIRDSINEALNPLSFGFGEIADHAPPVAQKVALKTLDLNSRINDRFGRFEFYLYKVGNHYVFSKPILAHGRIGIEILAYDKMDRSGFKCGINYIEMMADSQRVFTQVIDKINFAENRGILALMDYKALKTTGARFNKLYADDGTRLDYHEAKDNGELMVDKNDVAVKILLRDTYGNSSEVKFELKHSPIATHVLYLEPMTKLFEVEEQENTLAIAVSPLAGTTTQRPITIFGQGEKLEIQATYENASKSVYLVDLRKVLPDSAMTGNGVLHFDYMDVVPSGTDYKFYGDQADIRFDKGALYDTLYLSMSKILKDSMEVFSIGKKTTPLHTSIDITLKPKRQYQDDGKTGVYLVNGSYGFLGGEWKNDRVRFQTQELGDFVILRDLQAPLIRRIVVNANTARMIIRDDLSGIARYEATIDGAWLLMNYDYKTGILQSERLDKSKPLKGNFQLRVIDNAGNESVFNQRIP